MLLDTPICDFGWKAIPFELSDAHGKSYSFDDLMGEKGLLIAFICNHCPYVHAIVDRMADDFKTLQKSGVNVVTIMSNDYNSYPEDAPDKMIEFAQAHNFDFPYLIDETQEVAKEYAAVCTPDFFGFNHRSELQYRGRLDDARNAKDAEGRMPELLKAMQQVSKCGHGPKEQTPSMGCSIKWK